MCVCVLTHECVCVCVSVCVCVCVHVCVCGCDAATKEVIKAAVNWP